LIELIIVMAIIAILAGIMSLVISGFVRDARIETDQNMAQQAYMGFQNMLTKCEIMQDRECFDADALDGNTTYSSNALTYCEIKFIVSEADISGDIEVISTYGTAGSYTAALSSGDSGYTSIKKAIGENLSFSTDGTVKIYADVENYVVDSACYLETTDETLADTQIALLTEFGTTNKFRTIENIGEHKDLIKNNGAYLGAYPYSDALI